MAASSSQAGPLIIPIHRTWRGHRGSSAPAAPSPRGQRGVPTYGIGVLLVSAQPHQQGAGDDDHQQDHHHHRDEEALEVVGAAQELAGQVAEQAGDEAERPLDAAAAAATAVATAATGAFAAAGQAAFGAAKGAGPAAASWLTAAFLRVLWARKKQRDRVRVGVWGCRGAGDGFAPAAPELWGCSIPLHRTCTGASLG